MSKTSVPDLVDGLRESPPHPQARDPVKVNHLIRDFAARFAPTAPRRTWARGRNRPKKVLQIVEDATVPDRKRVKITTKRLVGGRWRTTTKYVPRVAQ